MLRALILLVQTTAVAPDSTIVAAVRAAAEREPVEAFGTSSGFVRVGNIVLLDIDGDRAPEAFVQIEPKVRQTPTILVYAYDQQHGARRLLEGLVPGSPQPVSGRLVDDHTLGFGIDMTVGSDKGPVNFDALVANGVVHHMSLVRYATFLHADGRTHFVMMVDLSNWKLPPDTRTCQGFEFSPVEALAAGRLTGKEQAYLVALTASDITIYRFRSIRPNGLLGKESWVRPRAAETAGLSVSAEGVVGLRTRDGHVAPLAAP